MGLGMKEAKEKEVHGWKTFNGLKKKEEKLKKENKGIVVLGEQESIVIL